MKRKRYIPRPLPGGAARPFETAEEAWFWFIRAHKARRDGRRFEAGGGMVRPCEADDVYLAALTLVRAGVLRLLHLRTLLDFGVRERAPDARVGDEAQAARLWDEALDRMATVLRRKGILA
ncbi:MAG: hypothetical protein COW30_14265 [Rhodospirillales bacterium CG15_BIG_FIL_POST_REV_8_21_14_020_66_15]|nr:MAG: hypothetical protein COW30_14265 [Rhodospirillales bacterium CG15_BIG_FIL_POST_REV_8_21_14_020_66_15]